MKSGKSARFVSRRIIRALSALNPLHQELVIALARGEDDSADETLAARYRMEVRGIRFERLLARKKLEEVLALQDASES